MPPLVEVVNEGWLPRPGALRSDARQRRPRRAFRRFPRRAAPVVAAAAARAADVMSGVVANHVRMDKVGSRDGWASVK